MRNTFEFMQAFPEVNFRYMVIASEHMASGLGILDFKNSTTWNYQLLGRKDGANGVKLGGNFIKQMVSIWHESSELQKLFPDIVDYVVGEYNKSVAKAEN